MQKLDHLLNGLRRRCGIARRMAIAHKKSAVADNAVSDGTETREEDKKPFFEERWDRIVEVGRRSKAPQSFDDFRHVRSGHKKVGH